MNNLIVILGATGDLARKKIFPALYQLFIQNKLDKSIIVGAALDQISAEQLLVNAKKYVRDCDNEKWHEFGKHVFYHSINFSHEKEFDELAVFVSELEKKYKLSGNRLVYCSTAPYFYCTITHGLAKSGIIKKTVNTKDSVWQRIVYEKPFGHDLKSAHEVNECIARYFEEYQIYRIDHYLTKELVGNIALVRFTNIIFEPLWNNRYIDQVQIVFDESIGIEGRGAFYDKYGALADVMQNHMMQLVALVAMESPEKLSGDYIRTQRAKVLQKIKVVDALLGQFKGYVNEPGVAPDSKTETFAQVHLLIDNPRWAGVPFYLKTGKLLNKKETAIYIKFKQVDCLLTRSACPSQTNYLTIEVSPDPVFELSLNAKRPGKSDQVMPVQMAFSHPSFGMAPEAYETLFEEILKGEQSVSVRFDEIEYAWKIIDSIKELRPQLYLYEAGSQGPAEQEFDFEKKHGMQWLMRSPKKGNKK
ncbi:MAG: glucose-6-phosphate 1-dehydrogenase [Candidatus Babeliales bacterium]